MGACYVSILQVHVQERDMNAGSNLQGLHAIGVSLLSHTEHMPLDLL